MTDAATEIVFYTHPFSRGRTVRWMLEELGRPYRTELLKYGPEMKTPEFLAINPMGKVPALTHRGRVVTEGAAICAYLADAFPEAGLAPAPTDPARGAYYRWLFFAAGPFEAAVTDKRFGLEAPEAAFQLGYGAVEHVVATLKAELETVMTGSGCLAGDRFSAADLYMSSFLDAMMHFQMVEKLEPFVAYTAKHCGRPAAKRAEEIDDALAKEEGFGPPQ